jgi:hypothetical protein
MATTVAIEVAAHENRAAAPQRWVFDQAEGCYGAFAQQQRSSI